MDGPVRENFNQVSVGEVKRLVAGDGNGRIQR